MFKKLIKENIAPLLKQQGFEKKWLTWNKSINGIVQVINLQLSRFNNADEESFTINIGLFSTQLWDICWGKEAPKFINEEDCFPRLRIGQIINGFSAESVDKWWECDTKTNETQLGEEVKSALETKCLPCLDGLLDSRKVIDMYSQQPKLLPIEKIYLAIIKNSIGDFKSSIELLNSVSNISNAWCDRVNQVRAKLGV